MTHVHARPLEYVLEEIRRAESLLAEESERAFRLCERIRVDPALWSSDQYPMVASVWVVAVMGRRCLYLNPIEGGWGWGCSDAGGRVVAFHWQDDELSTPVFQTLLGIDEGGSG